MAQNKIPKCISQVKELEAENGRLHRQVASLEAAAAEQGRSHATLETQASSSVRQTECQRRNRCIAAVHRMHDLVSSAHKSNRGLVQLDAAKAALATAEEQLGTLKAADGRQKLDLENVRRGASEVQQQRDALADERCAA